MCIGGGCGRCGGEWDYPRVVYRNIGHVISMLNPSLDYCAKSRIIPFNDARLYTSSSTAILRPPKLLSTTATTSIRSSLIYSTRFAASVRIIESSRKHD